MGLKSAREHRHEDGRSPDPGHFPALASRRAGNKPHTSSHGGMRALTPPGLALSRFYSGSIHPRFFSSGAVSLLSSCTLTLDTGGAREAVAPAADCGQVRVGSGSRRRAGSPHLPPFPSLSCLSSVSHLQPAGQCIPRCGTSSKTAVPETPAGMPREHKRTVAGATAVQVAECVQCTETAARPSSGGGSAWAVLAGGGRSAPSHCEPSRNPSPRGARTWSRRGPWTLARAPALSSPGPERGPRRWAAMSTEGPPPPAAPSGRPGRLLEPARTLKKCWGYCDMVSEAGQGPPGRNTGFLRRTQRFSRWPGRPRWEQPGDARQQQGVRRGRSGSAAWGRDPIVLAAEDSVRDVTTDPSPSPRVTRGQTECRAEPSTRPTFHQVTGPEQKPTCQSGVLTPSAMEDVQSRTRTGIALLHREGSGSTYDVRLKLTKEVLTIQKQDVVCVGGSSHGTHHRTVTLRREPVGGLGLSIKGGAEHRVPAVISRIFRGHAADQTGMLFVGDAVLQVNGINVEDATHEEVVHLLRNAGDEVTITVEYLRDAPSFLKLPLGDTGSSSKLHWVLGHRDWSLRAYPAAPSTFMSGDWGHRHSVHDRDEVRAPSSPSSPVANEPKYEKRWLDTLSIPLSMARISRYKAGAEKLRSSAFKVLALDGVSTGILQFHTAQESADWLRAVSTNISDLTRQRVRTENKCSSPCDQVVHMGWVSERLEGTGSCHTFRSKFLALKGSSLHVFSTPPVSMLDWVQAEKTYNLCEVLFKLHKFWLAEDCWLHADLGLGPRSLEDTWPYCFSVLVGRGQSRLFSVELGSELAAWERSFQRATSMEVQRTGSRTYACSWQGETLCFTVDFALGFTCFDSKTKNVLWRFKFSQLKGSSDDGNTRVKLLFQHLDTKQIEVKELEFPDLTAVLHCIHAFLAAKVASVDPTFMDRQSIARKVLLLSTEH
ncbi:gamma-2-syntrophin [Eumetopias jubatus]|uniref:gamma-2-syntrophin n=1 Tax=Eumetopias jubatus TaxID=34886 RepID=UPI0010168252|nr:gamma-2-syntrophin [Eumetopias jubatus]